MSELVITEKNFNQHFFDVRQNKPQRGQVIACYSAMADFVRGHEKQNIIDLILKTDKMLPCSQVMRKLLFASEIDAYRVPRMMAEDLLNGMSVNEVQEKPYRYKVEMYFYTEPDKVPKDDPHWTIIELVNLEEHLDSEQVQSETGEIGEIRSKIIHPRRYTEVKNGEGNDQMGTGGTDNH